MMIAVSKCRVSVLRAIVFAVILLSAAALNASDLATAFQVNHTVPTTLYQSDHQLFVDSQMIDAYGNIADANAVAARCNTRQKRGIDFERNPLQCIK